MTDPLKDEALARAQAVIAERASDDLSAEGTTHILIDNETVDALCRDIVRLSQENAALRAQLEEPRTELLATRLEVHAFKNLLTTARAQVETLRGEGALLLEKLSSHDMGTSYGADGKPLKTHCLVCDEAWPADAPDAHAPTCAIGYTSPNAAAFLTRHRELEANQRTPGTNEVCGRCGYGKTYRPIPAVPVDVECWDDCEDKECPILRAEKGEG